MSTQILDLPHKFDRRVMDEDYDVIRPFLQSVDNVREREWGHGNGAFFHIVAEQWMQLAELQFIFLQPTNNVIDSVIHGLNDFVQGLELGHPVGSRTTLEYSCAAIAVNDPHCARSIASAPHDLLGFFDNPEDPFPELPRAVFALISNLDSELQNQLEILHGQLFEHPLAKNFYSQKTEMANLYHLLVAIQKKDASEFNKRLLERCQMRVELFNRAAGDDEQVEDIENVEDVEPPSLIDWTALGLVYLAMVREIEVTVQHVYIPLQILETALLVPNQPSG